MKDFFKLLLIGGAFSLVLESIIFIIALVITYIITIFTDYDLFPESFVVYLILKLIIGIGDIDLDFGKAAKCPSCNKKVKSSLSAKCVECGGLIKLK